MDLIQVTGFETKVYHRLGKLETLRIVTLNICSL